MIFEKLLRHIHSSQQRRQPFDVKWVYSRFHHYEQFHGGKVTPFVIEQVKQEYTPLVLERLELTQSAADAYTQQAHNQVYDFVIACSGPPIGAKEMPEYRTRIRQCWEIDQKFPGLTDSLFSILGHRGILHTPLLALLHTSDELAEQLAASLSEGTIPFFSCLDYLYICWIRQSIDNPKGQTLQDLDDLAARLMIFKSEDEYWRTMSDADRAKLRSRRYEVLPLIYRALGEELAPENIDGLIKHHTLFIHADASGQPIVLVIERIWQLLGWERWARTTLLDDRKLVSQWSQITDRDRDDLVVSIEAEVRRRGE
jgi:hypothetical protein